MTFLETVHKPKAFPRSSAAFKECFNTNEKCLKYIVSIKWLNGWNCSRCSHNKYSFISTRNLIRCKKCKYEESFIANTMLRYSKKPIRFWFWTIYLLSTKKMGLRAIDLYRELDFGSYRIAWQWLHIIRKTMVSNESRKLIGNVEIYVDYIKVARVKKSCGNKCQKILLVCAAEVYFGRRNAPIIKRIRLGILQNDSIDALKSFINTCVGHPSVVVLVDRRMCYKGLTESGTRGPLYIIKDPREVRRKFRKVQKIYSQLSTCLVQSNRFISRKRMKDCLNEYVFRFNRGNNPQKCFNDLLSSILLNRNL